MASLGQMQQMQMVDGTQLALPDPADPDAALAAVLALRRLADRLELASVQHAIDQGWTWAQIAQALGVTRQAAHKRHAHRVGKREGRPR